MNADDTILALAVLVMTIAYAAVSVASMLDEQRESPLRRWRKLRTPPCRLCAHHAVKSDSDLTSARWNACTCPIARERAERLEGRRVEWLRCLEVRGTRGCVFEPKKKKEEEE